MSSESSVYGSGGNHNHVSYDYSDKKAESEKVPKFNGDPEDLSWWKTNFYSYIMGLDEELWDILEKDILVVQIYVDDIIFGSTNASLCKEFSKLMQDEFEISIMGELKFFLDIQINQCKDGVYVHQTKYTKELLKKFKLEDCKLMNTPMHPTCVTPYFIIYLFD